ncbi:MAG: hypothetical protein IBJ10_10435 [Phycisphaerales bacterium]|nr:hypothetical protein [Phycisphaerales bacterium]
MNAKTVKIIVAVVLLVAAVALVLRYVAGGSSFSTYTSGRPANTLQQSSGSGE